MKLFAVRCIATLAVALLGLNIAIAGEYEWKGETGYWDSSEFWVGNQPPLPGALSISPNYDSSLGTDQFSGVDSTVILTGESYMNIPDMQIFNLKTSASGKLLLLSNLTTKYINRSSSMSTPTLSEHDIDLNGNTFTVDMRGNGNFDSWFCGSIFGNADSKVIVRDMVSNHSANCFFTGKNYDHSSYSNPLDDPSNTIGSHEQKIAILIDHARSGTKEIKTYADISIANDGVFVNGYSGSATLTGNVNSNNGWFHNGYQITGSAELNATVNGNLNLFGTIVQELGPHQYQTGSINGHGANVTATVNGNVTINGVNNDNDDIVDSDDIGTFFANGQYGATGIINGKATLIFGHIYNGRMGGTGIINNDVVIYNGGFNNGESSTGEVHGNIYLLGGKFRNWNTGDSTFTNATLTVSNYARFEAKVDTTMPVATFKSTGRLGCFRDSSSVSTKLISDDLTFEPGAIVQILEDSNAASSEEFIVATSSNAIKADPESMIGIGEKIVIKYDLKFSDSTKTQLIAYNRNRLTYQKLASKETAEMANVLDKARTSSNISTELKSLVDKIENSRTKEQFKKSVNNLQPRQISSGRYYANRGAVNFSRQFGQYGSQRIAALRGAPYKLSIDPAQNGIALADINPGAGLAASKNPGGIGSTPLAQVLPQPAGERESDRMSMTGTWSAFGRATTGYSRVGAGANRIGLTAKSVGAVFGFDVRASENIVIGFAGSYDYQDVNFHDAMGSGRVNSYRFGPYALAYTGNWFFETELTFGIHDNKFTRRVDVAGTVYSPRSNYQAYDFTANIGGGYDFEIAGLKLTPRANLQYQFYHAQAFSERGGAGANMHVNGYDTNSLQTRFGIELWKRFEFAEAKIARAATPFFNIGWRHEWLAPAKLSSRFTGGGDSFNVDNELYSRNAIYLGIGSTFELSEQLNLDLRYQADLGDNENHSQNASINLRWKF